jgi:hypothetical protein
MFLLNRAELDLFAMAEKAVEVDYEILQGKQPAQLTTLDFRRNSSPATTSPSTRAGRRRSSGCDPCAGGILPVRRRSFAKCHQPIT